MGHTFEQSWTKIPPQDEDLIGINEIDKKNMEILIDDSWRGIKKCCPIVSGGLNPVLLKPFMDLM